MKHKTLSVMLVAGLVLTAGAVVAQVEPAPFITIHYDRIDPAQMAEWETNGKKWVEAFRGAKMGPDFYWRAYQSGLKRPRRSRSAPVKAPRSWPNSSDSSSVSGSAATFTATRGPRRRGLA